MYRWWHDWEPNQLDELAGALVVGRTQVQSYPLMLRELG